jgi:hypothetical protein
MDDQTDSDLIALQEVLERHFVSAEPLEVVYFGGGLPGALRTLTPLRYCEKRGPEYLIALCHQSEIEKTFRLDRMHLPSPPLVGGNNDFKALTEWLGNEQMIEAMLAQIAGLGNLPIEKALAAHYVRHQEFVGFFDEYSHGGYTLELTFTSTMIVLTFGYEAQDAELIHYHFTPEKTPRLTSEIGSYYRLMTGIGARSC